MQCWQYLQGFESMQPLTGHQRPLNTSTSPYTSLQLLLMFAGIEESWSLRLLCLWRQDSAQSTPLTPPFSESLKFFHSQCHVIFIIHTFHIWNTFAQQQTPEMREGGQHRVSSWLDKQKWIFVGNLTFLYYGNRSAPASEVPELQPPDEVWIQPRSSAVQPQHASLSCKHYYSRSDLLQPHEVHRHQLKQECFPKHAK